MYRTIAAAAAESDTAWAQSMSVMPAFVYVLTLMDEIVTLGSICMQHVFDYRAEAMHSVTKYKCLVCSYSLKSSLFSKYCCIIIK